MIMIFDRKQDFFDLAIEYNFLYFLKEDFCDNWCMPPKGVDSDLWNNIFAEILATHFELRIGAQGLIVDILTDLAKKQTDYPNLQDVSNRLYEIAHIEKSSNREVAMRLVSGWTIYCF